MGTVETIVSSMLKMSEDKKAMAKLRYEDHSAWLSREFSLIRELIQQDPPEAGVPLKAPLSTAAPAKRMEVASSSSADTNNKKAEKRKSPEFSVGGVRSSPAMKRSVATYAERAEAAGLPSDLNKMKKDQLLSEIETRGGFNGVSMKSLKKDMVAALKELLMKDDFVMETTPSPPKENRSTRMANAAPCSLTGVTDSSAHKPNAAEQVEVVKVKEEAPTVVGADSEATASAPRSSSMVNIRNLKRNDAPKETEEERNKRTAAEFEARQQRHRNSQARKSSIDEKNLLLSPTASSEKQGDTATTAMEQASPALAASSPVLLQTEEETAPDDAVAPTSVETEDQEVPEAVVNQQDFKVQTEATSEPKAAPFFEAPTTPQPVPQVKDDIAQIEPALTIDASSGQSQDEKDSDGYKSITDSQVIEDISVPESSAVLQEPVVSQPQEAVKPAFVSKVSEAIKMFENKPEQTQIKLTSNTEQPVRKFGGLKNGKPVVETFEAKPEEKKKKGGLFGFMKSAKLLLSGQKAPKSEKKKTTSESKSDGPTTIADLRAMLAAEATKEEAESPEVSPVKKEKFTRPSIVTPAPVTAKKSSLESTSSESLKSTASSFATAKSDASSAYSTASSGVSSSASVPSMVSSGQEAPVVDLTKAEPPSVPSNENVPKQSPLPPKQGEDEYQMDDRDSSGSSDSGSGTDDESSRRDKKQKQIPDWARGAQLKEALEKQYGLNGHIATDPDLIFPEIETCSLEEIFGKKEGKFGKYSKRTSSAKWDADELTLVEKRTYRHAMGFNV